MNKTSTLNLHINPITVHNENENIIENLLSQDQSFATMIHMLDKFSTDVDQRIVDNILAFAKAYK